MKILSSRYGNKNNNKKKIEFSFKGFCIHPKQQQKTLMKERYEYT